MLEFEIEIDTQSIFVKEDINKSFRNIFSIQNFSVDLKEKHPEDIDSLFIENFTFFNNVSFDIILDEKSIVCDYDFRKYFEIYSFNVFSENQNYIDINPKFEIFFSIQEKESNLDLLNSLKSIDNKKDEILENKIEILKEETQIEEVVIVNNEKEEISLFDVSLNEEETVYDLDFRKFFGIHNFDICLNRTGIIQDPFFEEYFEIQKVENYDYNIINKLKKNLNSRKILTRDEIPDNEIDIFSLDEQKKKELKTTISIEEIFEKEKNLIKEKTFYKKVEFDKQGVQPESKIQIQDTNKFDEKINDLEQKYEDLLQKTKNLIKEKTFYKIIEVDKQGVQPESKIQIQDTNKFDEKINAIEQKYEDLLRKTKNEYESKLEKMIDDFSTFRNNVTQQVNRLAFISSATGGGAVNILDMDDVDVSKVADGRTLVWNSETKKFELEDFRPQTQTAEVFEVTPDVFNNQYVDLEIPADPEFYNLAIIELNGLVNYHPIHFTFDTQIRVNLEKLNIIQGDIIRVIYTRS